MNLGRMISRVRRQLPQASVESISAEDITAELNAGVDECNRLSQVFKGYTDVVAEVGKQIYPLHTYVPRWLGSSKNGVWWFDVTTGTSYWLFAKTIRWLDLYIRNWRDQVAGHPQWYWTEGNDLGFYPKPSTAGTIRVYHLLKATPMDNNNNYPWENLTTEITALQAFDDAIIAYARWKLSPAVGDAGEANPLFKEFMYEVNKASQQTKRRKDMMSDYDTYIRMDGQTS